MTIIRNQLFWLVLFVIGIASVAFTIHQITFKENGKIGGVNFVSPSHRSKFTDFQALQRINAKWVAFNPYAFSRANQSQVKYDYERSWWGEKLSGIEKMVVQAKKENLKVMLKPHVWVMGQGWCGDFDLKTEADWLIWEKDYQAYILAYSKMAERQHVELICIGTEYKIAATKRSQFWEQLIKEVRRVYTGKLTYAANWDNFQNIKFWNDLDYIGIDAYFPLTQDKNATTKALNLEWKKLSSTLQQFSLAHKKQLVFTEYGYKSTHFTVGKQWEIEDIKRDENVNLPAQNKAFTALYESIWNQPWFAGGFIWKWYPEDEKAGGINNSDYTPQHKPVEKIIKEYY